MNRFGSPWLGLILLGGALLFPARVGAEQLLAPCESCTQGVVPGTVFASGLASYFGKSLCQVFAAPETLLTEFTIWRNPDPNIASMHLYLCEVDSTGTPVPTDVVLDGPTLTLDNPSSAAIPVTFDFDPPFALPHRGRFGAAIKEEDPYCAGGFSLQTDSTASYPCGELWLIHKRVDCSGLGLGAQLLAGFDLRFQVAFACADSTPALEATWGQVKARYHD